MRPFHRFLLCPARGLELFLLVAWGLTRFRLAREDGAHVRINLGLKLRRVGGVRRSSTSKIGREDKHTHAGANQQPNVDETFSARTAGEGGCKHGYN